MAKAPVNADSLEATPQSNRQQDAMERALLAAKTGKSAPPSKTTSAKRASKARTVSDEPSEAEALGELLLQDTQKVQVSFLGTSLEFEASVQANGDALSMLIIRNVMSWTPPREELLQVHCEHGDFKCVYVGTRVTFGLRAVLIGFIILNDD